MPELSKLSVQLVPMWLWRRNLRYLMTQHEWGKLRKEVIAERGLQCSTCDKIVEESRSIFCHEEWDYDQSDWPWVARLTGIALTCWTCHAVEHWGLTKLMVANGTYKPDTLERLAAHFMVVNSVTAEDFDAHLDAAFERNSALSVAHPWIIDWGEFSEWVAENFDGDPFDGVPILL